MCDIFIKWDGLWCPCCGYCLRTKPRNLKYKAKLREKDKREFTATLRVKMSSSLTVYQMYDAMIAVN